MTEDQLEQEALTWLTDVGYSHIYGLDVAVDGVQVELTKKTGVKVYFADPHNPWQRVINGNTNCLLRQYLPKDEDFSVFSQEDLDAIA